MYRNGNNIGMINAIYNQWDMVGGRSYGKGGKRREFSGLVGAIRGTHCSSQLGPVVPLGVEILIIFINS